VSSFEGDAPVIRNARGIDYDKWIARIALALYLAAMFWLYFRSPRASVPDENWFVGDALTIGGSELYTTLHLGYGGIFWLLIKGSIAAFGSLGPRAVFFILSVLPACLITLAGPIRSRVLGLVFWFSMPMAWWYGKSISPDTLNVALISLAILALARKNFIVAALLLGAMVGVKLNTISILPAAAILPFLTGFQPTRSHVIRLAGLSIVAFLVGFLIAAPVFAINFSSAFATLKQYAPSSSSAQIGLIRSAFQAEWLWDMIYVPGIFASKIALVGFFLLFAVGLWRRDRIILLVLIVGGFTWYLLQTSAQPLGWYWFPFLTFFVMVLSLFGRFEAMGRAGIAGILAIGIGNGHANLVNLNLRYVHGTRLINVDRYVSCFRPFFETERARGNSVRIMSFASLEQALLPSFNGQLLFTTKIAQVLESMTEPNVSQFVDTQLLKAGFFPKLRDAPRICAGDFVFFAAPSSS
jgi:hypothetical protein